MRRNISTIIPKMYKMIFLSIIAFSISSVTNTDFAFGEDSNERAAFLPFTPNYYKLRHIYTDQIAKAYGKDSKLFLLRSFELGQYQNLSSSDAKDIVAWNKDAHACQDPIVDYFKNFINNPDTPFNDEMIRKLNTYGNRGFKCETDYGYLPDLDFVIFRLPLALSHGEMFAGPEADANLNYLDNATAFYPSMRALDNSENLFNVFLTSDNVNSLSAPLSDRGKMAILVKLIDNSFNSFNQEYFQNVFIYQCNYEGKYCPLDELEISIFSITESVDYIKFSSHFLSNLVQVVAQNHPDMKFSELFEKLLSFCGGWASGIDVNELSQQIFEINIADLGLSAKDVENFKKWWVTDAIPLYMLSIISPILSRYDKNAFPPFSMEKALSGTGDNFDVLHNRIRFSDKQEIKLLLSDDLIASGCPEQAKDFLILYLVTKLFSEKQDYNESSQEMRNFFSKYGILDNEETKNILRKFTIRN